MQLKDESLLIEKSYINGEWVGAQSGETFEVHGNHQLTAFLTNRPNTNSQFASLS